MVKSLLDKWDAPEQTAPLQRPIEVKPGDEAKHEHMPKELRKDYAPIKVLGVGSFGVVVLAYFVKNGHRKYKVAIKLVFSGGVPNGFSDKALRRLDREATLLGRLNHPVKVDR